MDTPYPASGVRFAVCPLCKDRRLVFGGLYLARCPECGYEPSEAFLRTLRQIVTLPVYVGGSPYPERKGNPELAR